MKLFTDGSVHPQTKVGYGAYLLVKELDTSMTALETDVITKRFMGTSSTKLELQTLLWALKEIQTSDRHITIYTDSQNTMGLLNRRERFEQNNYLTSKGRLITNHKLYQEFYRLTDRLECSFVKVKGHKQAAKMDLVDKIFAHVDKGSREALRNYLRNV